MGHINSAITTMTTAPSADPASICHENVFPKILRGKTLLTNYVWTKNRNIKDN